ncbi:MAG: hypothetical protein AB9891_22065 [Anaerolineaceae bacterium]
MRSIFSLFVIFVAILLGNILLESKSGQKNDNFSKNISRIWKTSRPFRWIIRSIIIAFTLFILLLPITIDDLYLLGLKDANPLITNYSASNWLETWGAILTFIGTISLGGLAYWQNHRFKKENDAAQNRLNSAVDALAEANKKSVEIGNNLYHLQEENLRAQLLIAQDYVPFLLLLI